MLGDLEVVIGLEVHAQLATRSKLFCACSAAFGAPVNSQTCPVCLGLPGALPVLNAQAVNLAVDAALALGCTLAPRSLFARKHYFYPDLPKGYQISQHLLPYAEHGYLDIGNGDGPGRIRIQRVHMEEDAGKNVHDEGGGGASWVDFNRSGVGLIEVVSAPDLRSSQQAADFLRDLRQLLRYVGACDGNMEEGSLRCDANVSLRRPGAPLGTRVELKNINSFRYVGMAIDYEVHRQSELLAAGGQVTQQTRLWDSQGRTTRAMRDKEEAADYRFFPEPDLPPLVLSQELVAERRRRLPELPDAKCERLVAAFALSPQQATLLCEDPDLAAFFEATCARAPHPRAVANWIINELLRELKGRALASLPFGPTQMGELVGLVEDGTISGKVGKTLFAELVDRGGSPAAWVDERGLRQTQGAQSLTPWVDEVLAAEAEQVAKYHAGKTNILGYLVGRVMAKSGGRANPREVAQILAERLKGQKPPGR